MNYKQLQRYNILCILLDKEASFSRFIQGLAPVELIERVYRQCIEIALISPQPPKPK